MPESQPGNDAAPGQASQPERVPELEPRQLEKLTEMVYRLVREELLLTRERRGEGWSRDWR